MAEKGKKVWGGKATVNDWMMKYIGLPIVWGWLLAAMAIVAMGIRDSNSGRPHLTQTTHGRNGNGSLAQVSGNRCW